MQEQIAQIGFRLGWLKWGGLAILLVTVFIVTWLIIRDVGGLPHQYWRKYCVYLEKSLQRQFIWTPGSKIATGQVLAMFLVLAAFTLTSLGGIVFLVGMLLAGGGPPLYIEQQRMKRVRAIEGQLDSFLTAMANALKATPSIGDAFISTQALMVSPIKEEINLAVKEMRVGSTLDDALKLMAVRIGSRQVDSALSALLIGRQVGGNLPSILDTTASTLREMSRLDAVIRSKTAEAKAQLSLLSVFPIILIVLFSAVSPEYFEPLTQSLTGYIIVVLAVLFWIGSLVLARHIVAMDLK